MLTYKLAVNQKKEAIKGKRVLMAIDVNSKKESIDI